MKLLEKILLAVDFGESMENLVQSSIELAKIFDSKVIPVHVLPNDIQNEKVNSLLQDMALKRLDETVLRIQNEGLDAGQPLLVFGTPHEQIMRAAIEVNANLILTGSGESKQDHAFPLGTTTERIIQKSEKPVFVIKEGVLLNVHHILCPVDFSDASKRALKNAITMARRFKSELTILNVCEVTKSSWLASDNLLETVNEEKYRKEKEVFKDFLDEFDLSNIHWVKELPKGNPAEQILSTVSKKMIDLLIMGTSGRTGLNRMFMGSVTEKVIREVPCSFLTLKSEDVISLQIEQHIKDIEQLHKTAMELMDDGFYEEAIGHLKACLSINDMHVPAYKGLAKVYEKLNQPHRAEVYRMNAKDIMDKIWYQKIEEEVRKLRGS